MPIAKKENFVTRDPFWAIVGSVVVGSVLTVYPLSYQISGWRPSFMLFIMLFWVLCQPVWCGIWFAFGLGIFTDLLLEMPLGFNAISFSLICYGIRLWTRDKRIMTEFNLWVLSICASVLHLLMIWLLLTMQGEEAAIIRHWQPLVSNLVVWFVVYFGLKRWRAV